MKELVEAIMREWGLQTEFSAKGNRYVAFVLQTQIDEMIEEEFSDGVMRKELTDMALVIIRHFARRDEDPEKLIMDRLNSRHVGKSDQIKEKYLKLYETFEFPQRRLAEAEAMVLSLPFTEKTFGLHRLFNTEKYRKWVL